MNYKTVKVGKDTVRYAQYGEGPVLLFLHGLGADPQYYDELLLLLARRHTVIAPSMYGVRYLHHPPSSVDECIVLTRSFCKALGIKPVVVVGHSLGGLVAMRMGGRAVALNPAFPVPYGMNGFLARSIWKRARAVAGIHGWRGFKASVLRSMPWDMNILSKPRRSRKLVASIRDVQHRRTKAVILYGSEDEFFKVPAGADVKRLPAMPHDWPIFYPARAAQEIEKALKR